MKLYSTSTSFVEISRAEEVFRLVMLPETCFYLFLVSLTRSLGDPVSLYYVLKSFIITFG